MNNNPTITQGIADFLNRVGQHLGHKTDEEKMEILTDLESHIHEALSARAQGRQSTLEDLQAVLNEMDPPESYGPSSRNRPIRQPIVAAIPRDLKIVAYIFLIFGVISVLEVVVRLFHGDIYFNFGALGIPIFFGLLKLRNGWRICAMVFVWFSLIVLPIVFILSLLGTAPAYLHIFGMKIARIPRWIPLLLSIPFFLLALWQYSVLTRFGVKTLFQGNEPG